MVSILHVYQLSSALNELKRNNCDFSTDVSFLKWPSNSWLGLKFENFEFDLSANTEWNEL